MSKRYKRLLAKIMAVVLLLPVLIEIFMVSAVTVNAAELPIVNEAIVTERVKELARLLEINDGNLNEGNGVLFTANGQACGHATNNAKSCTNCKNTYVVNTAGNWFNTKFGYTVNPKLLPGHYTPSGSITNSAWTCAGFVNFTLWYIGKADNTSDVYKKLVGTKGAAFTKSNLQKFDIRIGDVVRVPELGHSFMFLAYEGDSAIKVMDCNWVNSDKNRIAQVRIHTIGLNSSYTMAISRAKNYEPDAVIATGLPVVDEEQVTIRIKELAKLLEINDGNLNEGSGVLFTANGKACGHATNNAKSCTNCKNTYVVNTAGNWFNGKFGYTVNPELLPGHYTPSGSITNSAWTCAGFVNFVLWYIGKADSTSDVYKDLVGVRGAKFTKDNLLALDIRIGDVVRVPELNHSFVFLEYAGDNAIKVMDCNWVGGDVNKIAQVKIHTISLNSKYTMAISRARNYEPGIKVTDEPGKTDKVFGNLDLSATSWSRYNVGLNEDMHADREYTIRHGAQLEILGKSVNSKGNEIYHVYSSDLGMNCYVTAKYVKIKEAESKTEVETELKVEVNTESVIEAEKKTGWVQDENYRWVYVNSEDGDTLTGWFCSLISKLWYYLDTEKGYMVTSNWLCDPESGRWYYLDDNGAMCTGWITVDNQWYYLDVNGAMCTGWNKIDDSWYLFGASGAMLTGWQEVGGKLYCLAEDGKCFVNTITPDGYKVDETGAKIN